MDKKGKQIDPALCGGCDIANLDEDQRGLAIEAGRAILSNTNLSEQYGRVLLRLTVANSITYEQSEALLNCVRNNRDNKCNGLENPKSIYAVRPSATRPRI